MISDVHEYRDLPLDWDTFGGVPATCQATRFAVELLESLQAEPTIPSPLVRPISGGVFLKWDFGDFSVYFEVESDRVVCVVSGQEWLRMGYEDESFDVSKARDAVRRTSEARKP